MTAVFPDKLLRPPFLIPLGLFLLFVALSPGMIASHDASARLVVARQLWTKGSVFLAPPRPERFVKTPQGLTTYFGIGQSLVFIPFDILGVGLAKMTRATGELEGFLQTLPILFLYAPLAGLAWAFFLQLLITANGFSSEAAWRSTGVFLLSTLALPYIGQSLQEEVPVALSIAAALVFLFRDDRRSFTIAGFAVGTALLFRLTSVFALLPLLGLLIDRKKLSQRNLVSLFLGGLLPLILFLTFNFLRFGNAFSTGYDLAYAQLAEKGITTWQSLRPNVALSLLFGFGKGFFLLSPSLLIAFWGIRLLFRRYPYYFTLVFLSLALSALVHSKLHGYSCGGFSWGPRFQIHFLTHFALPFTFGLKALWDRGRRWLIAGLVGLGMAFQLAACFAPDSLEYHQEMIRLGDYEEKLITSFPYGQLNLRISNILRWISHEPLYLEKHSPDLIGNAHRSSIPYFWGYLYEGWSGGRTLGWWKGLLVLALGFLLAGVFPRKEVANLSRMPIDT